MTKVPRSSADQKHTDSGAIRHAEAADTQPILPMTADHSAEKSETESLSPAGLGMDANTLRHDIHRHLAITLGRDAHSVSNRYRYMATVLAVRDRLVERWKATHAAYYEADCKRGYYLSMEFLMGRALGNAALNLDIDQQLKRALNAHGLRLEDLEESEPDAGLGAVMATMGSAT